MDKTINDIIEVINRMDEQELRDYCLKLYREKINLELNQQQLCEKIIQREYDFKDLEKKLLGWK